MPASESQKGAVPKRGNSGFFCDVLLHKRPLKYSPESELGGDPNDETEIIEKEGGESKPPPKPKKAAPAPKIVSGGKDENLAKLENEKKALEKKASFLEAKIAELEGLTDEQIRREKETAQTGRNALEQFRAGIEEDFQKLGL